MKKLSARYASALFDLAMEGGVPNESLEQALYLRDTLQDADCQRFIADPCVSAADKGQFFRRAFVGFHDYLIGFLCLVVAKNRFRFLTPALDAFIEMLNLQCRKTVAEVISTSLLDEGQIETLKKTLSKKLDKQVDVSQKVDPSIIGGLFIHVDGYFIDRTIRKRLHDIKSSIVEGITNDS